MKKIFLTLLAILSVLLLTSCSGTKYFLKGVPEHAEITVYIPTDGSDLSEETVLKGLYLTTAANEIMKADLSVKEKDFSKLVDAVKNSKLESIKVSIEAHHFNDKGKKKELLIANSVVTVIIKGEEK